MLDKVSLRHWDFVMWSEVFLNENDVGFALKQQISVDRIVEIGDIDGFENETVVVVRTQMRRLPILETGAG